MKVRSTQIATFKQCPAKAYYRYELGLRKKNTSKGVDLLFGSMLHDAIDAFHTTEDARAGLDVINSTELPFDKIKNQANGRALYVKYVKENPIQVISSEKSFSFKIGNHDWVGRFDGVGKFNGLLYVLEHKTTKPMYLQTKPNDQFIAYWAGALIFYNDISGIIINSLDPTKIALERIFVNYSREEFYEWRDEMKATIEYYVRCRTKGSFPRHPFSCKMFNRQCIFHEICSEPAVSRQTIINMLYEEDKQSKELSW